MRVRVIERLDDLIPFRDLWNRLADRSPSATIFQTFEWLAAWWQVFGIEDRLRVVLIFDGETLVAAAPLMTHDVRAYRRTRTCLTFTGGMQADYTDVLYEDDASLRHLVHALGSVLEWDLLDLARIPSGSATVRALAETFPGWRGASSTSDICPAYVFDEHHDGNDILEKKSIRRHVSGLRKAGAVEVHHFTRADEVEAELEDFYQQHVERRSLTAVASNFLDARSRTFYRVLAEGLGPQGRLLFTVVALDGKPAAYHYGFVYRRRLVWYKPSFAPHLARLSPGEVLLAELFKYCQTRELKELDFTVGDELFKQRFSNVRRHNTRFRTYRSGALQRVHWLDRVLRNGARRILAGARRQSGTRA